VGLTALESIAKHGVAVMSGVCREHNLWVILAVWPKVESTRGSKIAELSARLGDAAAPKELDDWLLIESSRDQVARLGHDN
jgi:hypothetical protein